MHEPGRASQGMGEHVNSRTVTAAFLFVFAACRPGPVKQDLTPLPEPQAALDELRAEGAGTRNLRALGRVTYFGEKGRVRLKTVLLAERPGRFRVETLSPLEQPIDVMACDGTELWYLSKGRLRSGPATPQNISRLLPLAMTPEEVVDTFLGGVPTSERFSPVALKHADDDRWELELLSATQERVRLLIDPVRRVVERMVLLTPAGSPRVSVQFDDFDPVSKGARDLPRSMVLRVAEKDIDLRIKLTEADVDVALDGSLFRLEAPPGRSAEPL